MKRWFVVALIIAALVSTGCSQPKTEAAKPPVPVVQGGSTETGKTPATSTIETTVPVASKQTSEPVAPAKKSAPKPQVNPDLAKVKAVVKDFVEARGRRDFEGMKRFMSQKLLDQWVEGDVQFYADAYNFKILELTDRYATVRLSYHIWKIESSICEIEEVDLHEGADLYLIKRDGKWQITTPSTNLDCFVLLD